MSEFGRILQRHMDAQGKTARELAAKIDISPVALSKYIGGSLRPKPQILDGIEKELDLNPEEMAKLHRAVERARRGRVLSPMDRRMVARPSATRLGEWTVEAVLRRLRRDCGFAVEEPPVESLVRCDALISNGAAPGRRVGLIFHFQPEVDPEECMKTAKALAIFYDVLQRVLFYRPWLGESDQEENQTLGEAGGEIVYDWNLIAAINCQIPPTLSAGEYATRQTETIRSVLDKRIGPPSR